MSASSPSLPILIDADPASETALFSRERQTVFLGALAATGSVRSASARAGISHQTAYRARLASPGFRRGWDAALLAARAQAEEVLACRALDGIEEDVIYHGEVVATRRRYSDRLLLAHLGRLDRLCGDAEVAQFADRFDDHLTRFGAGEDRPARVVYGEEKDGPSTGSGQAGFSAVSGGASGEGVNSSPGQWSMWSTGGGEGGENSPVPLHQAALCSAALPQAGADGPPPRDGEEVVPPLPPVRGAGGGVVREAQQLEVGLYRHWWDDEHQCWLTNWPAPEDWDGAEYRIMPNGSAQPLDLAGDEDADADDADVMLDPESWARTLTDAEADGLEAAEHAEEAQRAARLDLYRRRAFALASAAELASLEVAARG